MGAWIEIHGLVAVLLGISWSHPLWVRGLKSPASGLLQSVPYVAPFVGAWIEIFCFGSGVMIVLVAPFVGAWIEITYADPDHRHVLVAPFVGAWIEIASQSLAAGIALVAPFVGAWIEMYTPR